MLYWLAALALGPVAYRWFYRHEKRTLAGYLGAALTSLASIAASYWLYHAVYL